MIQPPKIPLVEQLIERKMRAYETLQNATILDMLTFYHLWTLTASYLKLQQPTRAWSISLDRQRALWALLTHGFLDSVAEEKKQQPLRNARVQERFIASHFKHIQALHQMQSEDMALFHNIQIAVHEVQTDIPARFKTIGFLFDEIEEVYDHVFD